MKITLGKTSDPIPVRFTELQRAALMAKSLRTGITMQELIRRAVWHMLATIPPETVPLPLNGDHLQRDGKVLET